ncbi:SIMPL domain-containing protein [Gordonia paraffinivorans]|uniref:SIMPL domain-containing protein n=1 Tax=Gordonia paraffinivorans TaxID=175628 RepID=UPI001E5BB6FE|nr:SIMPL domain-containing protein [Gordonia paraffinivorans]MCD2146775.1 SIMPL domain-containing protein [Gordonia paraffinivorans]
MSTRADVRPRPARRRLGFVAALSAIALVLSACGGDEPVDEQRSVTVVGTGQVSGVPDTLRADIGVESTARDVTTALNETSAKVTAVTDAVVAAGVERKDIATRQVSVSPQYSSPAPGGSSQISGYVATNSVRITIRDISKASQVLAAAATAGGDATRISNVSFAIDDNSELLDQAREEAFDDARSSAEQYASLAGDSLGKVLTIKETTSGQEQPASPGAYDRGVAAAPVPLEPGEQELTFTVTVTFALD